MEIFFSTATDETHYVFLQTLNKFVTDNWNALLYPLDKNPKISVGIEINILDDGQIYYDRHFHLFLPREHYTLDPNALTRLAPTSPDIVTHSPTFKLCPPSTTLTLKPLSPFSLLKDQDMKLHRKTHGNRATDLTSYQLQAMFENASGPLKNAFPHHDNLPHNYAAFVSGDNPEDSDSD